MSVLKANSQIFRLEAASVATQIALHAPASNSALAVWTA